ncbi:FliH/SctL family protein [Cognatishimia sp. 1_MG-2023]|uniref:FliH/SctL family protein n=1 Tax=Cognatishimia sp. 1_MG-2023 TaxID=3062642 RepID=UPI0026E14A7A|nr:FliH/SctL family protein [Cognatishimia sp. 1_MG-2023]MDO6727888.1 FliH/SctL family protein [Cognatishimia sp. 1_MG-2023]
MMALNLRDFDAECDRFGDVHSSNSQSAPQDVPVFSFTEEELGKLLADARAQGAEQGHAAGLTAGRLEAQGEHQVLATAALNDLRDQMSVFITQDAQRRLELESDLVDMVLDICERVVPDLLKSFSTEQVQARLKDAIHIGKGQTTLCMRLSPATEAALSSDLIALANEDSTTNLNIAADPDLKDGEARMSWDNGFMKYSLNNVCSEVLDALRHASEELNQHSQKV